MEKLQRELDAVTQRLQRSFYEKEVIMMHDDWHRASDRPKEEKMYEGYCVTADGEYSIIVCEFKNGGFVLPQGLAICFYKEIDKNED